MENLLVVERAYGNGSWSLYRGRDRIFNASFGAGLPRAPEWFADVVAGLASAGVAPQSLDAVLAGTGPGSFSGIRSVIAALQGLALPRSIPVLGLSSAAALARATALANGARTVAVVGDARRGTLWSAVYDLAPEEFRVSSFKLPVAATNCPTVQLSNCPTVQPFNLSTPAELPSAIPPGALVVSPEYTHLAPVLSALKGVRVVEGDQFPTADDLAGLYFSNPGAAVRDPLPIYLHPAVVTR